MYSFVKAVIWRGRVFARGANDDVWLLSYGFAGDGSVPMLQRLLNQEKNGEFAEPVKQLFSGDPNEAP